jgi:hypothetical protein
MRVAVAQLDLVFGAAEPGGAAIEADAIHSSELTGVFDTEGALGADLLDDRLDELAMGASGPGVARCKARKARAKKSSSAVCLPSSRSSSAMRRSRLSSGMFGGGP